MEALHEFLSWAWARHHNPLSWYIRPLFVLPFCYFAYKKSKWGVGLTIAAVLSSMFWFPAPDATDPRAAAFLAMERQHITSSWTISKVAMTALVPAWFAALALAFWTRAWLVGFVVVNGGALLKVIWSFYFAGSSAWSIIPPVALGALVINGVLVFAYRRARRRTPEDEELHTRLEVRLSTVKPQLIRGPVNQTREGDLRRAFWIGLGRIILIGFASAWIVPSSLFGARVLAMTFDDDCRSCSILPVPYVPFTMYISLLEAPEGFTAVEFSSC